MVIDGMHGLGDNIYQRSVIREIKERVYLRTSWPQLYSDLDIHLVRPRTRLRTQKKNLQRQTEWVTAPSLLPVKLFYTGGDLRKQSILGSLSHRLGVKPRVFDMPEFPAPDIDRKYVIIRPNTVRSEWFNSARGAKTEYICRAAKILRESGYYVVSVADIDGKKEWCDALPECDLAFNRGELHFEALMGWIQNASLVVGSVGWIVPACAAAGVNLITVLGGQGTYNHPRKLVDKPMDNGKIRFIEPDNYCMCGDNRHACNKTISDFDNKFVDAVESLEFVNVDKAA